MQYPRRRTLPIGFRALHIKSDGVTALQGELSPEEANKAVHEEADNENEEYHMDRECAPVGPIEKNLEETIKAYQKLAVQDQCRISSILSRTKHTTRLFVSMPAQEIRCMSD